MFQFLFAGSVVANGVLALMLLRPRAEPVASESAEVSVGVVPAVSAPPHWNTIRNPDPATFRSNLAALGVPSPVISEILRAEANRETHERARQQTLTITKFWETPPPSGVFRREPFPPEFSADKREQLRRIAQDYGALEAEAHAAARGALRPADLERLRFLAEERARDIAALLSEDEVEIYELWTSPRANRLRAELSGFGASEAEFRALYAIQTFYDEQASTNPEAFAHPKLPLTFDEMMAATYAKELAFEAALGSERYAEFYRKSQPSFQELSDAGEQFGLEPAVVEQIFDLGRRIATESARIGGDLERPMEERSQAIRELAESLSAEASALAGPAAEVVGRIVEPWFSNARHGYVVVLGRSWSGSRGLQRGPADQAEP